MARFPALAEELPMHRGAELYPDGLLRKHVAFAYFIPQESETPYPINQEK